MHINDLFLLLIVLTSCLIILTLLIFILYCKTLKYIKTHSKVLIKSSDIPDLLSSDVSEISEVTDTDTTTTDTTDTVPVVDSLPLSPASNPFILSPMQPTEEVDIIQAANDAIKSLSPFAKAQNIKIHLSTTCEELMVMAVPESIRILFRNIIDNSIKYMGRAGHMIITISLLGDDIFVILKDTGKGLNEEETTHIFELNFQGSNRVSGNGLGLTQSKMIVEAFGGTIYAKSSPENGMAIYIQLPVSKKHD